MDDDTTTLISELLQKLAELQQKVDEYSLDMAHEFKLYEDAMLKGVPRGVSSKVERAIANSLHNYPALNYGLGHQQQQQQLQSQQHQEEQLPSADSYLALTTTTSSSTFSPSSAAHTHGIIPSNNLNRMAPPGDRGSPLPVSPSPPVSGSPDNDPSSPRERERELHGLFIPSYLPLLEAAERQTPTPPLPLPTVPENGDKDLSRSRTTPPRSLTPLVVPRPDPVRRHTEDTLSSITSDDSNTKVKRSALRRSSSSSIKTFSPRRVRFEVEGQEVLPTASPQTRPSEHLASPLADNADITDESYQPHNADVDEMGLLGSSPPRPKKITSTDKLKALARKSREDTSAWTVVGNANGSEDDESNLVMPSLDGRTRRVTPQAAAATAATTQNLGSKSHPINGSGPPNQLGESLQVNKGLEGNGDVVEDEDEVDDDILSMPTLTSFKGKKRFSPPESTLTSEGMASQEQKFNKREMPSTNLATSSSDVHGLGDEDELDPLFEFEDASDEDPVDRISTPRPSTKYIEEEDDDDDEAEDRNTGPSTGDTQDDQPSTEEKPEAKPSTPRKGSRAIPQPPVVVTPQSRFQSTSVGSFRGKPIHIGGIRNPEVYEKAMAMGDIQSFIGSVDGRTGVDESTSYQPEATRFGGTPRSLSERLLIDEMEEMRRNAGSAASYSN
ncbi:hypothetical protein SLS62_006420 [Diatrype stigma]|uniref:Uncharacterized protein n=1 Tax=Diatrype stigma TaxID=117547 RepID=A0AAN9YRV4_9PEZI